ncbi:restriction endonuclease S subunits [Thiohalobacter thiocyanaticus]|uniref:Restriction endonuclease S subunits n=1 Tax=Thiohalobacter thiocyanaticus TaxID=585455 RepID=A0A1Z4VSK1_9GAMM|nr:restriction endonuclease subunit S [Thiohalobacter thiocyanaticus]BAZ94611.1 restriction endonuclease S subunits [Thiohalobacter thiocyanaticus]
MNEKRHPRTGVNPEYNQPCHSGKSRNPVTDNLDLWTSAILTKSITGRGSNGKQQGYGIKKLRELILELAVRGKLVSQDPNDEPASVLLEKIADEKTRLIKEGKIKKPQPLSKISKDEIPYALPVGWEWARFGNIFELEYGNNLPQVKRSNTGEYPVYGSNGVVGTHNEYSIESPCIVVGRKGSAGALNLCLSDGCWVTDVAYSVVPPSAMDLEFTFKLFHTLGLDNLGKGIKPGLSRNEAYILPVVIPPLAEQHRIVSKVDELMALCDQLEQQQTHSLEAHQALVETLLATLTSVESADDLDEAWSRIASHFDTLFATEHSIDQLKQTILQLAIMGKLVPQDPNDEPASVLLEKIAKEKTRLVKEKKIRKEKKLPEIGEDEKPFEQKNGWEWVRLGQVVHIRGGKRVSNGYQLLSNPTPYIYIRVSDMKDGAIDDSDLRYIDEAMYSKISQYIITKNDIYMTIVGATIGKCGLVPDKFDGMNLTENAARLTPFFVSKIYLYKALSTAFCQEQFIDKTKQVGVQKMALNRLASTIFPLPPLAEQHRIVAKVDELMFLCDALKSRLADAQNTQRHFADAIVEQAVA